MKKKPLFKENESGVHRHAKEDLAKWIKDNPSLIFMDEILRVELERKFCSSGFIIFTPDITVYDNEGVKKYVEICHTHAVDNFKLFKMKYFNKCHQWNDIELIEVSAKWVLDQCEPPNELKILKRIII